jgi:hypothetical protein
MSYKPGSTIIATSPYGIDSESGTDTWAIMVQNVESPYYEIILPPLGEPGLYTYLNIADAGEDWREFTQ